MDKENVRQRAATAIGLGLLDMVGQHYQYGPYVVLVHTLPDLCVEGIRRLLLATQTVGRASRPQSKRATESRRAA